MRVEVQKYGRENGVLSDSVCEVSCDGRLVVVI